MIVSTRTAARLAALAAVALAATGLASTSVATAAPAAPKTADLRLIAFNDFHGNLVPPAGSSGRVTLPNGTTVDAGGAAYMATHVKALRGQVKNSLVLSAGDNIGASPLNSALFHDEPTIEVLERIGMKTSAAGNHEFDEGYRELLRMQTGGCHPTDGCQFQPRYNGSDFPFLGANVTFKNSQLPALAPFWLSYVQGVPVGFIGVPLEGTPEIVAAEGIKDIQFRDEIESVNRYANILDRLGVKTIVLTMHQGDTTAGGGPNACNGVAGPGRVIAEGVSPKVDVVFAGHSHQQFNCTVTDPAGNPRTYIQGLSFGRVLSVVDLKIDRRTRDVIRSQTRTNNHIVTRTVTADAGIQAIVDDAKAKAAPIANRPLGTISADITRVLDDSGENALGNTIADAQLVGTQPAGAQIALMNPGGVRADLLYASGPAGEGAGVVTYGEAFTVQPFGNVMTTVTLTGAQLKAVLEQQFVTTGGAPRTLVLLPSAGFTYTWSTSAAIGSKVSAMALNGVAIDPAASYRVSVNNFLADGGDGFTVLRDGTVRTGGKVDLDTFSDYLAANPNLAPAPTNRITVVA